MIESILTTCHVAKSKIVPFGETSHTLLIKICASAWNFCVFMGSNVIVLSF
jgi:hypothetical protein